MNKLFINHLHGDHMNDLMHTYCFGPSADRKAAALRLGLEGLRRRKPARLRHILRRLGDQFLRSPREAARWHTESFSFQATAYDSFVPPTMESWGLPHDPAPRSATTARTMPTRSYPSSWIGQKSAEWPTAMRPRGVKVTHFPVIHCRRGAMGYKMSWKTPDGDTLSMIYTSDTKPETNSIEQAKNGGSGADVFIHEMQVPPEIMGVSIQGLDVPPQPSDPDYAEFQMYAQGAMSIQNSSHTTQGAFGYMLSRINPRLRLTVLYPFFDFRQHG